MDSLTLRPYLEAHLTSLTRGDIDAISDDFVADLRAHVPGIVASLPPLVSAENISVDMQDDKAIVFNRLTADGDVIITMRSEWITSDGRPRILSGAPIDD